MNVECKNPKCSEQVSLVRRGTKSIEYCSYECSRNHSYDIKISLWINGDITGATPQGQLLGFVRDFLLKESNYSCGLCFWNEINPHSGKCHLDIDHIDGDFMNNSRSNLQVICPNCHSLTPTYKSLNKNGRGRRSFQKRHPQFMAKNDGNVVKPISEESFCSCGTKKYKTSKNCKDCAIAERSKQAEEDLYPPIDTMISEIQKIGVLPYARTLGKSDSAIKKFLIRRGVPSSDLAKKHDPVFCFCGEQTETNKNGKSVSRLCVAHQVVRRSYPELDEILKGVQEMGLVRYSRSIGVEHHSTLRRYIERQTKLLSI